MGLALAWLPASQTVAALFAGGATAEIWSVDGDINPHQRLRIETPRDLNRMDPGERLVAISASPSPPRFEHIRKIVVQELQTEWIASRPEKMESYRLGTVVNPVPPPPDWKRTIGQIPPWHRVVATEEMSHLPYLDHAVFCWADPQAEILDGSGDYLFRQSLQPGRPEEIAQAILRVATNGKAIEIAFNQYPVHLAAGERSGIMTFEVTSLLTNGPNILALRIREDPSSPEEQYGVAFHLEVTRRPAGRAAPPRPADGALLLTEEGDRLWGRLAGLRGNTALLNSPFGELRLPLESTIGLLFPLGWRPDAPAPGLIDRLPLFGGAADTAPTIQGRWGLPIDTRPDPVQDLMLLTEGRVSPAQPSYAVGDTLHVEGFEGRQVTMPISDVLGIYPPRTISWTFKRPDEQAAVLYCELTTTGNDQVGGLLRKLDGRELMLEAFDGQFLRVRSEWISELFFPYHSGRRPGGTRNQSIAIINQFSGQEAFRDAFLQDAHRVQEAIFSIRADSVEISADVLASTALLTPAQYPVLVSVDPLGEYLHTLTESGDAVDALLQYLDRGGVLIALSRGGAFRSAVRRGSTGLTRTPTELVQPSLSEQLGIRSVRPTDADAGGVISFAHPPNGLQPIHFQRTGQLMEGLEGLPRHVTLAPMMSAPYFPMVGIEGQARVIYELVEEGGAIYGPALSVVPRGQGFLVLIDHLLWESRPDGRPFEKTILPILLQWALDTAGG
ncbi:MAG TPA: hypothetical protein PLS90_14640 [Candidatus Sumerlaeota bacterium]|nr:hypothetical protein [Candidatus Sumerlaeota bacterium]